LGRARRRVEQNAGVAGIDRMSTKELRPWLGQHWPQVRTRRDAGTYRPQPVRRMMIPKRRMGSGRSNGWGRRFLEAGVMADGGWQASEEGTPQGSPLSPLLVNIMLDDLDREVERRGQRFVRYADDLRVRVRSEQAGQRVMASIAVTARSIWASAPRPASSAPASATLARGPPIPGS
jgi:retron-type reverse transcriptase